MWGNTEIKILFQKLNEEAITYAVSDFNVEKNIRIELLVHPKDREKSLCCLKEMGFFLNRYNRISKENGCIFLYPMLESDWLKKEELVVEIFYQMTTKALRENAYLPLDGRINDELWRQIVYDEEKGVYFLSKEYQMLYIITKSILDKHFFSKKDIEILNQNAKLLNEQFLQNKLKCVFFLFTNELIKMIQERRYDDIFSGYIKYSEY